MFGMCWGSYVHTVLPDMACSGLPALTQVNCMSEAGPGHLLSDLLLQLCKLLWTFFTMTGLAPFPPLPPSLWAFQERKMRWISMGQAAPLK